jgi:hypothetical protein
MLGELLSILLILDTDNIVAIPEDSRDLGLLENLDAVGRRLSQVFQLCSAPAPGITKPPRTFSMRAYVMVMPGNWAPPRCVLFSL